MERMDLSSVISMMRAIGKNKLMIYFGGFWLEDRCCFICVNEK